MVRSHRCPRSRLIRGVFAALALSTIMPTGQAAPRLELLLSHEGDEYRELAETFQAELARGCALRCTESPELQISTIRNWQPKHSADLLIAVGNKAAIHALVSQPRRLLYGLIPRTTWENLTRLYPSANSRQNAVYLDQPLARQFDLIALTLPADKRRVGVILGPESSAYRPALRAQAANHGVELITEQVLNHDEVGPAVERLSARIDILLALPDAEVFNRETLYGILLTSYSARVPVVGYSAALVEAGAMIAVYTPVSVIARDLARASVAFVADGDLPEAGPSRSFAVAINHNVARSLGYDLPDSVLMHKQLTALEGRDAAAQAAQ